MSFLFYAVLIVWTPLRAILSPDDNGTNRWPWILRYWALVGSMVLGVVGEAWLLRALFHSLKDAPTPGADLRRIGELGLEYLVPSIALGPFVLLLVLIAAIQALRATLWLWDWAAPSPPSVKGRSVSAQIPSCSSHGGADTEACNPSRQSAAPWTSR